MQAMCDDGFEDMKRMRCVDSLPFTPSDYTDANTIRSVWLDNGLHGW